MALLVAVDAAERLQELTGLPLDPYFSAPKMRWLRDRAWRGIWLNPLAGSPGFSPSAEGMAAALEFVDDFPRSIPKREIERSVRRIGEAFRESGPHPSVRDTGAIPADILPGA